jgi:hypothetical protein
MFLQFATKCYQPIGREICRTGGMGQNRVNRRNLLPNCYQKTDKWVWG